MGIREIIIIVTVVFANGLEALLLPLFTNFFAKYRKKIFREDYTDHEKKMSAVEFGKYMSGFVAFSIGLVVVMFLTKSK